MKLRVVLEMSVVVVTLFLAFGVSDGLVLNKCELRDKLNSTLPANMLDKITNLVAKIVCHVNLSSHFNTSAINYITGPSVKKFIHGGYKVMPAESSSEGSGDEDIQAPKSSISSTRVYPVTRPKGKSLTITEVRRGRKGRSAESSSEESGEEDYEGPKRSFNSTMVNPVTLPKGNRSTITEGPRGRKSRSAESSSEESGKEDYEGPKRSFNSTMVNPVTLPKGNRSTITEGPRGRKSRSAESSSEESGKEDYEGPKRSFNSTMGNPVTLPKGNRSTITEGPRGRKSRSAESRSEESSEEDVQGPKNSFNSTMVNPVTLPKGNRSTITEGHRGRKSRSAESSSEESEEQTIWTLYGLFQLPNRIACTSGSEPSLNLCKMDCDRLTDDSIQDDIICVETILNKMMSAENSNGPTEALFRKLSSDFFQKQCVKVENSQYFSTC